MDEHDDSRRPPCPLPERIFAVGEEPTGVRVTPYHKADGIKQIFNALHPDEIEEIRGSPFGKLIEIAEKPSFSGRFGRYILSRQLKVLKKHEAWFLFAGKPIRFSIREFALVTGLNCKKFPKRCKKKSSKDFISQKPYWIDLFGSLTNIPVSSVVKMLERKTVVDREIRLKYAYLAILSAVLLPTTHTPRISPESAEMIKDLDVFLAYPWGRVSFNLLMSSIKERKEVSLSQNTIALKGFVLALQLVMVECVPALTEVVQEGSSSGSEDEDDSHASEKVGMKSISPGHARDIDAAGKALVQSIMLDENGETSLDAEYEWSDDEDDVGVSNMVNLIHQHHPFISEYFLGGSTKRDVSRMREESKAEVVNRKTGKSKVSTNSQSQDGVDVDLVASLVREKLKDDFQLLHGNIATMQEALTGYTDTILVNFSELYGVVQESVAKITTLSAEIQNFASMGSVPPVETQNRRPSVADVSTQTIPDPSTIISEAINFANRSSHGAPAGHGSGLETTTTSETVVTPIVGVEGVDAAPSAPMETETDQHSNLDPALVFPNPTFSLGLTQEPPVEGGKNEQVTETTVQQTSDEDDAEANIDDAAVECRKTKRQKVPTRMLMGEYQCDKSFLNRAREAVADAIYKGGNIDYVEKFSVLLDKMKTSFSIATERGVIDSTELYQVVDRTTNLSSKVLDVLMFHTSTLFRSQAPPIQSPVIGFMDTQFVSEFMKLHSKFTRVGRKDTFKFSENVVAALQQTPLNADAVRFYFPFNLDNKYWVGICVDCSCWSVTVLDCNIGLRTDNMMNKEIKPIAVMFPYLMKFVGRNFGRRECKPMTIVRPRSIPQQNAITHSGISSVLFIQAHAVGGVDTCKCITPDVIESQVERCVVSLYEATVGPL